VLYLTVLLALAKPLGWFMARVYEGKACGLDRVLGPVERVFYRLAGVRADQEMGWKRYAAAMLVFNALGFLVVYGLQRLQQLLPFNPQDSWPFRRTRRSTRPFPSPRTPTGRVTV